MKKLVASVAMSLALAGGAFAGGFDDPIVEGEVFEEVAAGSLGSLGNGAVIGGVLLLALVALSGDDDDSSSSTSSTE